MAALELAIPETEPVELRAIGGVQLGELALQLAGVEQRVLELRDGGAERVGEAGEPGRAAAAVARDDAAQQERPLGGGDHGPVCPVAARDPFEEVVEGANRAA